MSSKKSNDKDSSCKNDKNSSTKSSQEEKKEEKFSIHTPTGGASKQKPMILMKPQPNKSNSSNSQSKGDNASAWKEVSSSPTAPVAPKLSFSLSNSKQNDKKKSSKQTDSKSKNVKPGSNSSTSSESNSSKVPNSSIKMIDSTWNWCEAGIESLIDQEEFLVVGVIGMQGVGKSTIMSMLANPDNKFVEGKSAIFREETLEQKERATHMTTGVDFTVTDKRVILLDTQPILSPSILDFLIKERKSADFNTNTPSIHAQSLQIVTFMLTVCHVVIVVQDYFTDSNVYSFLKKAEMVKPATPIPHDSDLSNNQSGELHPVIVFVHNKLESNMFSNRSICNMNAIIDAQTRYSNLYCKDHFSLSNSNVYPGLSTLVDHDNEVNQFLFPNFYDSETEDTNKVVYDASDQHFLELPQFTNRPGTELLAQTFANMILSIRKHPITHQVMSETSWFHYAARSWETIKKSQNLLEFSRLISS